jgi:hypothetical protein|tara:strand:+ start:15 stop:380 length:366 start_codon:yes stop_codon:yes gene_type:complete
MTNSEYTKSMKLLAACVDKVKLADKEQHDIWRRLLIDLPGKEFLQAVLSICKEGKEIFPNTIIPAILREETNKFVWQKKRLLENKNKPKLLGSENENEEKTIPNAQAKILVKKFNLKLKTI